MSNNHYYRLDANGLVAFAFSDAFYPAQVGDYLVETGGRHFNPVIMNERGQYVLKFVNGAIVARTQSELDAEWNSRPPGAPTLEDRLRANEEVINFLLGTVML